MNEQKRKVLITKSFVDCYIVSDFIIHKLFLVFLSSIFYKNFHNTTTDHLLWCLFVLFSTQLFFKNSEISENHIFPKLKEYLGRKQFANNEDLKQDVMSWLKLLAVEEYNIEIEKLIPVTISSFTTMAPT